MKWIVLGIVGIGIVAAGAVLFMLPAPSTPSEPPALTAEETAATAQTTETDTPPTEVIAENLTIPWEILFLPDGELLVTERPGNVVLLRAGEQIPVPGVRHIGEGGLLGAALHPDFSENRLIYLYQTTEQVDGLENRIVRYRLENNQLTFDQNIITGLPGARYHDGGRIAFGPDGYLYAALGDATDPAAAQDTSTLAGSIIRLTADGAVPDDNPIADSALYSYGHRNPQGLSWDSAGRLWSSEHGRSVGGSGFDEINLIQVGGNYGWPESEGDDVAASTIAPVRHSTAAVTWAPGDILWHEESLYVPGLRGATLYEATLDGERIVAWHEHFAGAYGRLRSVAEGPDGLLYLLTSNRDGRGDTPARNDDRIIRIDPAQLQRSQ